MNNAVPKPLAAQLVPTFSLYGEHQWPTPDLLHWESVAERSAIHNWAIKPHRHANLCQVLLLSEGEASANIDGRQLRLKLPCLLVIPQLCVHGFQFSPDINGHVLTLASPLLQIIADNLGESASLLQLSAIISVDESSARQLTGLLDNIAQEYKQQREFRDFALRSLVSQLVLWIVRHNNLINDIKTPANGKQYFSKFMQLVENCFREHLALEVYAKALGISKPHLNSICRQIAKHSALQLIHQRILLEAKRNLVYTVMTVGEISDTLGFSEPPYFTRFFKRLTGCSPLEFRQRQ
jgi:AraC family transcriptional activator of pobA